MNLEVDNFNSLIIVFKNPIGLYINDVRELMMAHNNYDTCNYKKV